MNKGKWKCEELKRVRAEVARANGIEWEERECSFEGECRGTCPMCEAELRRLTRMIKEKEGARVVGVAPLRKMVVGMGVGAAVAMSACGGGAEMIGPETGKIVAQEREVGEREYYMELEGDVLPPKVADDICWDCMESKEVGESDYVYARVDEKAEFEGGQKELFRWLGSNLIYPKECAEQGVEGRVIMRFVVEKDGSVSNVNVVRGAHELLDKEAVRVVGTMPKWRPGKIDGKVVRSKFTLPVVFKLEGKD